MFGTFESRFFQTLENRSFHFPILGKILRLLKYHTFKGVIFFQTLEPSSPETSSVALWAMEDKMLVKKVGFFGAYTDLMFSRNVVQIVTV